MQMSKFLAHRILKICALLSVFTLMIVVITGCAGTKSEICVAQYNFNFEDEAYRIRSISNHDGENCQNELIGGKFLAVDLDQDRILDRIVIGDILLKEAQVIYEYGLESADREGKISEQNATVSVFTQERPCCYYEIKSFRPVNAEPFNEFKVIENRSSVSPSVTIGIDRDADGTLEDIVKGDLGLEEVQAQYKSLLNRGIDSNQLVKVDRKILVKQQ